MGNPKLTKTSFDTCGSLNSQYTYSSLASWSCQSHQFSGYKTDNSCFSDGYFGNTDFSECEECRRYFINSKRHLVQCPTCSLIISKSVPNCKPYQLVGTSLAQLASSKNVAVCRSTSVEAVSSIWSKVSSGIKTIPSLIVKKVESFPRRKQPGFGLNRKKKSPSTVHPFKKSESKSKKRAKSKTSSVDALKLKKKHGSKTSNKTSKTSIKGKKKTQSKDSTKSSIKDKTILITKSSKESVKTIDNEEKTNEEKKEEEEIDWNTPCVNCKCELERIVPCTKFEFNETCCGVCTDCKCKTPIQQPKPCPCQANTEQQITAENESGDKQASAGKPEESDEDKKKAEDKRKAEEQTEAGSDEASANKGEGEGEEECEEEAEEEEEEAPVCPSPVRVPPPIKYPSIKPPPPKPEVPKKRSRFDMFARRPCIKKKSMSEKCKQACKKFTNICKPKAKKGDGEGDDEDKDGKDGKGGYSYEEDKIYTEEECKRMNKFGARIFQAKILEIPDWDATWNSVTPCSAYREQNQSSLANDSMTNQSMTNQSMTNQSMTNQSMNNQSIHEFDCLRVLAIPEGGPGHPRTKRWYTMEEEEAIRQKMCDGDVLDEVTGLIKTADDIRIENYVKQNLKEFIEGKVRKARPPPTYSFGTQTSVIICQECYSAKSIQTDPVEEEEEEEEEADEENVFRTVEKYTGKEQLSPSVSIQTSHSVHATDHKKTTIKDQGCDCQLLTLKYDELLNSFVELQAPGVKLPVSCIKLPGPCVEEPVQCVEESVQCVKKPVSCVESPVSYVKLPVTCVEKPVQCVKKPVTCVESPVSCVKTPVLSYEGIEMQTSLSFCCCPPRKEQYKIAHLHIISASNLETLQTKHPCTEKLKISSNLVKTRPVFPLNAQFLQTKEQITDKTKKDCLPSSKLLQTKSSCTDQQNLCSNLSKTKIVGPSNSKLIQTERKPNSDDCTKSNKASPSGSAVLQTEDEQKISSGSEISEVASPSDTEIEGSEETLNKQKTSSDSAKCKTACFPKKPCPSKQKIPSTKVKTKKSNLPPSKYLKTKSSMTDKQKTSTRFTKQKKVSKKSSKLLQTEGKGHKDEQNLSSDSEKTIGTNPSDSEILQTENEQKISSDSLKTKEASSLDSEILQTEDSQKTSLDSSKDKVASPSNSKTPDSGDGEKIISDLTKSKEASSSETKSKGASSSESKNSDSTKSKGASSSESKNSDSTKSKGASSSESKTSDSKKSKGASSSESKTSDSTKSKGASSSESKISHSTKSKGANSSESKISHSTKSKGASSSESKISDSTKSKAASSPDSKEKVDSPPEKILPKKSQITELSIETSKVNKLTLTTSKNNDMETSLSLCFCPKEPKHGCRCPPITTCPGIGETTVTCSSGPDGQKNRCLCSPKPEVQSSKTKITFLTKPDSELSVVTPGESMKSNDANKIQTSISFCSCPEQKDAEECCCLPINKCSDLGKTQASCFSDSEVPKKKCYCLAKTKNHCEVKSESPRETKITVKRKQESIIDSPELENDDQEISKSNAETAEIRSSDSEEQRKKQTKITLIENQDSKITVITSKNNEVTVLSRNKNSSPPEQNKSDAFCSPPEQNKNDACCSPPEQNKNDASCSPPISKIYTPQKLKRCPSRKKKALAKAKVKGKAKAKAKEVKETSFSDPEEQSRRCQCLRKRTVMMKSLLAPESHKYPVQTCAQSRQETNQTPSSFSIYPLEQNKIDGCCSPPISKCNPRSIRKCRPLPVRKCCPAPIRKCCTPSKNKCPALEETKPCSLDIEAKLKKCFPQPLSKRCPPPKRNHLDSRKTKLRCSSSLEEQTKICCHPPKQKKKHIKSQEADISLVNSGRSL